MFAEPSLVATRHLPDFVRKTALVPSPRISAGLRLLFPASLSTGFRLLLATVPVSGKTSRPLFRHPRAEIGHQRCGRNTPNLSR
jgi:hypothetical protein